MAQAQNDNEIKIKEEESSLAEFTKRAVPNDEEMRKFDKVVEGEFRRNGDAEEEFDTDIDSEADEKIEASLNEIYDDGNGGKVDVKKLDKVRRHGLVFKFFMLLVVLGMLGGIGYGAYYFYKHLGSDVTALDFKVTGETEVMSGEEFFYTISYNNDSNINFNNAKIEVSFPDNFVFLDSTPPSQNEKNNVWEIGSINRGASGEIKIKGFLAGAEDQNGIIVANATYNPEGVSSEFRKESSLTTNIKGVGLNIDFDYTESTLVGEVNEIDVVFSRQDKSFINNFRVTLEPQDNMQILSSDDVILDNKASSTAVRPGVWQIDQIADEAKILPVKFKFTSKKVCHKKLFYVLNNQPERKNITNF